MTAAAGEAACPFPRSRLCRRQAPSEAPRLASTQRYPASPSQMLPPKIQTAPSCKAARNMPRESGISSGSFVHWVARLRAGTHHPGCGIRRRRARCRRANRPCSFDRFRRRRALPIAAARAARASDSASRVPSEILTASRTRFDAEKACGSVRAVAADGEERRLIRRPRPGAWRASVSKATGKETTFGPWLGRARRSRSIQRGGSGDPAKFPPTASTSPAIPGKSRCVSRGMASLPATSQAITGFVQPVQQAVDTTDVELLGRRRKPKGRTPGACCRAVPALESRLCSLGRRWRRT